MTEHLRHWREQWRDAWYFFLAPAVAALLPWRGGWRWLMYWGGRAGNPFHASAQASLAVAREYFPQIDAAKFLQGFGYIALLDRCDLFVSLLRRRRDWTPWHIEQVGEWPQQGPFVAAGLHFGAGYWLHHLLARAGHDCATVAARFRREDYREHPLRYWYGRLRFHDMERISRRPTAYRPGVKAALRQTLADGAAILSLVDMPPQLAPNGQLPVRLLDLPLSFPQGIIALAREANAPIVPFWIEFDERLCTRRLCVGTPLEARDPALALQTIADILDRQLRRTPQAWMFWPLLPQWLADAASCRSA